MKQKSTTLRLFCPTKLIVFLALATVVIPAADPALSANEMSQCRTIMDPSARLRCYESLQPPNPASAPPDSQAPLTTGQMIGHWRLVRTPNPRGTKDAVSIMRSGELYGSDPDFAGLMIRCSDEDTEVLAVLLRALPLRARPNVSVNGTRFEATVAPPGTAVLLPAQVSAAAKEKWRSMPSLSLDIDDAKTEIKGLVSLEDFDAAYKALTAACAAR